MKKIDTSVIDMNKVINRLFEGDCLEYMNEIPDGSVDMILCDLPYGMTQNEWDCYISLDDDICSFLKLNNYKSTIRNFFHFLQVLILFYILS